MTCQEALNRLSLYVDGELDASASAALEQHTAACPDCSRELARLRALAASLRAQVEYHRAPDLLRERVRRQLFGPESGWAAPARRVRTGSWRWLAAAAAVVLLVGAGWLAASLSAGGSDALARDVVAAHIRSLLADHLTDVASTDQHTVKPWFNGRLDFSPTVADFAAAGYPLAGGRLEYLDGHPVAALVYTRRRHVINVFQWPAPDAGDRSPEVAGTRQGYHLLRGVRGRMAYWIVSDLSRDELEAFGRMLLSP